MKTEKEKENDNKIKQLFVEIKIKGEFLTYLANCLDLKNYNVVRNWFYTDIGIPVKHQKKTLEKVELQLKYQKKTIEEIWHNETKTK